MLACGLAGPLNSCNLTVLRPPVDVFLTVPALLMRICSIELRQPSHFRNETNDSFWLFCYSYCPFFSKTAHANSNTLKAQRPTVPQGVLNANRCIFMSTLTLNGSGTDSLTQQLYLWHHTSCTLNKTSPCLWCLTSLKVGSLHSFRCAIPHLSY